MSFAYYLLTYTDL